MQDIDRIEKNVYGLSSELKNVSEAVIRLEIYEKSQSKMLENYSRRLDDEKSELFKQLKSLKYEIDTLTNETEQKFQQMKVNHYKLILVLAVLSGGAWSTIDMASKFMPLLLGALR